MISADNLKAREYFNRFRRQALRDKDRHLAFEEQMLTEAKSGLKSHTTRIFIAKRLQQIVDTWTLAEQSFINFFNLRFESIE